jgi:heparosan-N-sulfate-glucuronate 5-epimerase
VFLSDAVFHPLGLGAHIDPAHPLGYYIDLRAKAEAPVWPPPWLAAPAGHAAIAVAQWGLACHERLVGGEGDHWLEGAAAAGTWLVEQQDAGGRWLEPRPYPHTYRVQAPWPSAMAQGEGASLLVRLHTKTGEERFAEAAVRALGSYGVPTEAGGVRAELEGGRFFEEYPTRPGSYVLNGGIFALFGAYDVAASLGDEGARQTFAEGVATLAANIGRWDTGRWSRYDLYPHPLVHVATLGYHRLHVAQLRALHLLAPDHRLDAVADRFDAYARSRVKRAEALARKVAFRLVVRRPLRRAVHPLPA